MTEIYAPYNFEKVCLNTVLESMRESEPLVGPRAFFLCMSKLHEFPTSFRYLLTVILFENREELLPHLKVSCEVLGDSPDRRRLLWALVQTFIHSLITPNTTKRLIEDEQATTDWLVEEMKILTRTAFGGSY